MTVAQSLLVILSVVCSSESRCSSTSFYKNCWIRRFPGIFIDIAESERRGAQVLKLYQEESALKCSRTCCLTRNFSCNLAVFHYDTFPESVNCFHLHCPALESCVLRRKSNAILYNVTKGVDPDLLVFGKHLSSNVRVWPFLSSAMLDSSEPLTFEKRLFHRPLVPPASSLIPTPTEAAVTPPSSKSPNPTTANPTSYTATITDNVGGGITVTPAPSSAQITSVYPRRTAVSSPISLYRTSPVPATTRPNPYPGLLASINGSKQPPNNTKGYASRNHTQTEGKEGEDGGDSGLLPPSWHMEIDTLLVPVVVSGSALLVCCCCCCVLVGVCLRARRKSRYRASWRNSRGSMHLINYVIVKSQ